MSVRINGGIIRGRSLKTTRGTDLRPTSSLVRGAIFSVLGERLEGTRVLDLFAGTGALGIEALSRGAAFVDFVETNRRECTAIRANLCQLGLQAQSRVHPTTVENALTFLVGPYDTILADPPYASGDIENMLVRIAACKIFAPHGILVLEHKARLHFGERYECLGLLKRRRYGDTAVSMYQIGEGIW